MCFYSFRKQSAKNYFEKTNIYSLYKIQILEVKISSLASPILLSRDNYCYKFGVTSVKYVTNIDIFICVNVYKHLWKESTDTGVPCMQKKTGEQRRVGAKFFPMYSFILFEF